MLKQLKSAALCAVCLLMLAGCGPKAAPPAEEADDYLTGISGT